MSEYPRVTEVLSPYIDFSMVPEATLAAATYRGTQVHSFCAAYALKLWVPIDNTYAGYFKSFQIWFDSQVKRVLSVEEKFIDEVYGFMGHPDIIVEILEGIVLVDLKTPIALQKAWQLQTAAYLHLARKNGYKPDKAGSLRLDPDGGVAKMEWYKDSASDLNIFLGLLNGWRYFNE